MLIITRGLESDQGSHFLTPYDLDMLPPLSEPLILHLQQYPHHWVVVKVEVKKKLSRVQSRVTQHKDSMNVSFQHSRDLGFLKQTVQGRNPISTTAVLTPANRIAECGK